MTLEEFFQEIPKAAVAFSGGGIRRFCCTQPRNPAVRSGRIT